jgi:hypothetical protein
MSLSEIDHPRQKVGKWGMRHGLDFDLLDRGFFAVPADQSVARSHDVVWLISDHCLSKGAKASDAGL